MFLGVVPTVVKWSPDGKECSLLLEENPLTAFVELPEGHGGLAYSNLLCGVLRGALEMVPRRPPIVFCVVLVESRRVVRGAQY